jgi:hypothetical protein
MLNPWFELLATRPQLLASHAQAWGGVLAAETAAAWAHGRRRLLLQAVALLCAAIGVALAGVALMLWAVASPAQLQQPGAGLTLLLVPLVALGGSVVCALGARSPADEATAERMARLAQQWRADLALLQTETP